MGPKTPRLWTEGFYQAINPSVNVVGFGRTEPGGVWQTTRHINPDVDLWYVAAGQGRVLLDGEWCDCSAGDVIVIKLEQRHEKEQ